MIGNPILLLLVVGPMAAAVIGYLIGRVNKSARDYFADAVTILAFLTMVYFFLTYKEGQPVSLYVPEICGMGLSFKLERFQNHLCFSDSLYVDDDHYFFKRISCPRKEQKQILLLPSGDIWMPPWAVFLSVIYLQHLFSLKSCRWLPMSA